MEQKQPQLPRLSELDALPLEPDFAALAALCRQEERPVAGRRVKGAVLTGEDLSGLSFSGAAFEGSRETGSPQI